MAQDWYYRQTDETFGPISSSKLKELAQSGHLGPDDLVRREDMEKWKRASKVKGLFPDFAQETDPLELAANESPKGESSIWERLPVIAPLILCCFPIGLFLLWNSSQLSKLQKMLWTCGFAALVIFGSVMNQIQTQATQQDLARADSLWNEGSKAEAAAIYKSVIDERRSYIPTDRKGLTYGRVIDHLAQQGMHDEAKQLLDRMSKYSEEFVPNVESDVGQRLIASSRMEREQKRLEESRPKETIRISSSQLFAEYEANDIAADRSYKGKTLEVSGAVGDISRDILGTIYVTLKAGKYDLFSIQCFFADDFEDRAAQLHPGEYLTIRGRCDGKFGNVMVKDCIIVE